MQKIMLTLLSKLWYNNRKDKEFVKSLPTVTNMLTASVDWQQR